MFKDRLREIRVLRGYTQKQASKLLNISERSYQRYESGEHNPDFDKLKIISKAFDISLDYLFNITDNPNSHKA